MSLLTDVKRVDRKKELRPDASPFIDTFVHFLNTCRPWCPPIRPEGNKRPPMYPVEPGYPCYVSVLGEFTKIPPHGGLN